MLGKAGVHFIVLRCRVSTSSTGLIRWPGNSAMPGRGLTALPAIRSPSQCIDQQRLTDERARYLGMFLDHVFVVERSIERVVGGYQRYHPFACKSKRHFENSKITKYLLMEPLDLYLDPRIAMRHRRTKWLSARFPPRVPPQRPDLSPAFPLS